MIFVWNTTIYLLEGCIISLFLFLIASVFIPALKKIRPHYLHNANIAFAILGLIMLGLSIFLHFLRILVAGMGGEVPVQRDYSAMITIMVLLLLGIVPVLAFSRKRNTTIWFTCLLLISISAIMHSIEIWQWIRNITGIDTYYYSHDYEPDAKWYRIAAAVLLFVVPYWFARRKISRA
ncbi:hypothetical protein HHL17_24095 [Chitinophaga sp. G-6-1-13]|uniref:Uncharacterized protein n=1 Tax=Chitinophaga fulva TaxID=2728842 RepID=A0A848GUI9_9BACT|nr:hypothetical protein [Chitinophaga fulva]NML40300.1 hypothetical protein [Chitinophaga fulva]